MLTKTMAYMALSACLMGIAWRISRWFRRDIGPESDDLPTGRRLAAAGRALAGVLFSRRVFKLTGVFLWEVMLQGHLLRQNPLRWFLHMALSYGFVLLVFMHALGDWTAPYLGGDYAPTLNPFRWLRNFLAALVLAGALGTMIRHRIHPTWQRIRSHADRLVMPLLAVIVVSGILLEGSQILSPAVFNDMVEDYMGDDDPDEVAALQGYWAAELGAWQPLPGPAGRDYDAALGEAAHEAYCASCHTRPQAAFLSYPVSRVMKPAARIMAAVRVDIWLWYLHYMASCLALACLPFTRIFHLIATPANLLARAAGPVAAGPSTLRPMRRALGLDACTHCGACSVHCSVAPIYQVIPNTTILPSEKLQAIKTQPSVRMRPQKMAVLAEGSFICTLCGRCTQWCPSGIELQDLWQASRQDLIRSGWPTLNPEAVLSSETAQRQPRPALPGEPPLSLGLTDRPETFWACVQCTTCTSVCPVVAASDDPQRDLDLTPQQIMNLMRLQLKDQAFGSRMLWDCVTCYKCQEHCPQDVKVADVLYELRNEAYRRGAASGPKTDNIYPDALRQGRVGQ